MWKFEGQFLKVKKITDLVKANEGENIKDKSPDEGENGLNCVNSDEGENEFDLENNIEGVKVFDLENSEEGENFFRR